MNVFKEIIYSIYNYKYYPNFLKNKKSKVFWVGVLLVTLYFLITMIFPATIRHFIIGGIADAIEENVPDFSLKDGILSIDKSFEFEEGDTLVYIDTSPDFVFYEMDEMEEALEDYRQVILMDSEKVIIKDSGEIQQMYYDALGLDFERDDLMKFVPYVYAFIIIFWIIAYIWDVAVFFFGVLFIAIIGMIIASCMKKQITFGQIYMMGVYSRTLPLMIKALVSFLPFSIPMFWVLNFGVSVVILVVAMNYIQDKPKAPVMQQYGGAYGQNPQGSVYYDPRMNNRK